MPIKKDDIKKGLGSIIKMGGGAMANPIIVAIIATIIVLIIVLVTYNSQETFPKRIVKTGIYVFAALTTAIFIHNAAVNESYKISGEEHIIMNKLHTEPIKGGDDVVAFPEIQL
jgi:hypothetical protein